MTKHERIRAACTDALARLGLDVARPDGQAGKIPPEVAAAMCYALARCVQAHQDAGAALPGDLNQLAEAVVLQQAIRDMHDSGGPSDPTGNEWSTRIILGRIQCIFREQPHRFSGPDHGRRSPADVCVRMVDVIGGGGSEVVEQWLELEGAAVADLPQRFASYVLKLAREQLGKRPDPTVSIDQIGDRAPEIKDMQPELWERHFEVTATWESLRFVDLVIGEEQRRWLKGYLVRAATQGGHKTEGDDEDADGEKGKDYDYVKACLLTNKLCAAWLIWGAPRLLRAGGDAKLLAELVRDAYAKLAGEPQTDLFGVAKDICTHWLRDVLSR